MTQRELVGRAQGPGLLDRIMTDGLEQVADPVDPPDLQGYLSLAVAGGLPPAVLNDSVSFRRRWYSSYLDQLVTRDAADIDEGRDPIRLRRYVDVLAENTAGLPSDAALYEAGSLNSRTAARYDRLFQALGVLDIVPAWSTNRLKRLQQRGKRYLTDTGLTAAALRVGVDELMRAGDLNGRMIDAFVAAQIRAEAAASDLEPICYHVRDNDGREVDLLLDYGRRGVIAIEIRASSAPKPSDAKHLVWLRDSIPTFRAGIVFHTGPRAYRLHGQIMAVPIASLWA